MTNRYEELSERARWFMQNFDEIDIADICASNEAAVTRLEATLREVLDAFEAYWARASYCGPRETAVQPEHLQAWRATLTQPTPAATEATETRTALAEALAYLHALTRVGGSVIGYQTVNDIPEASYDRWCAVRDAGAGEEPLAWSPPPPGDRREQLPDDVLRLLVSGAYTCDPCQTARSLHAVALGQPEKAAALNLDGHRERLHAMCQIRQPWTGLECRCRCPKTE